VPVRDTLRGKSPMPRRWLAVVAAVVAVVLVVATMAGVMRWEDGGASTGSPASITRRIWHVFGFDYEWRDLKVPRKLRVLGEQLV
jgi:hypothetical protein